MYRRMWVVVALLAASGCGYSEDEWQAQLSRYKNLSNQFRQEQTEHAQTQQQLAHASQRVEQLEAQLRQMGVNLDGLHAQLQETGTEKEQLASSLEQYKRALEEYKARAEQLERIKARFELLRRKLKKLTELGLKVEIRRNRMVIRLPGDLLFDKGSDKLKQLPKAKQDEENDAFEVLRAVADVIRNDGQLRSRYFQVAGHTDDTPLKGGRFRDNWGLSLMRARQVLLYLIGVSDDDKGSGGLNPQRFHAAGYGETDPVATNETAEGRQQNRRVELVLMPDVEEMLDLRSLL